MCWLGDVSTRSAVVIDHFFRIKLKERAMMFFPAPRLLEDDTHQSRAPMKNKRVAAELASRAPNHQFPLPQLNTLETLSQQVLRDELIDSSVSNTDNLEDDTHQSRAPLKNKRVAAEFTSGAPNHQFPLPQLKNTLEILSHQVLRDELIDSFVSDTDILEDDTHQLRAPVKNKRVAAEFTSGAPNHQFPLPQCKEQRGETTKEQSSSASPFVEKVSGRRFRSYQEEQWYIKFNELVAYKRIHSHCQVPHRYRPNQTLAQWAKRQRYQYKQKQEAKPSTMTDERIAALENQGFVWDSRTAQWFERLDEVMEYKMIHGDCNVPAIYPSNPKMATWVKCQRRQKKLLKSRQSSNMTEERIILLDQIDFIWEIRKIDNNQMI